MYRNMKTTDLIVPVAGKTKKLDRIERLVPITREHRLWLPEKGIRYITVDKQEVDLVEQLIEEELRLFPNCKWFDMLDSLARIIEPDLYLIWPKQRKENYNPPSDARLRWERNDPPPKRGGWMSA